MLSFTAYRMNSRAIGTELWPFLPYFSLRKKSCVCVGGGGGGGRSCITCIYKADPVGPMSIGRPRLSRCKCGVSFLLLSYLYCLCLHRYVLPIHLVQWNLPGRHCCSAPSKLQVFPTGHGRGSHLGYRLVALLPEGCMVTSA